MSVTSSRKKFGAALRRLRLARRLTLRGLGKATGIPFPYLSLIESGDRGIGPVMATKLADRLGLEVKDRNELLLAANRTFSPMGRRRATSHCPPLLAEILAQQLEELLGAEVGMIQRFEWDHLRPHSDTFSNSPTFVLIGYLRGASPVNLEPRVVQFLLSETALPLGIFVHPDGKLTVIRCIAQTF